MQVMVATTPGQREAALAIRRQVFCLEQQLFDVTDRDVHDEKAIHLIALVEGNVVGTVRLFERDPGVWVGGRLAVLPGYRGGTGFRLVQRAVEEARRQGAEVFLASVQAPNERFFHRLGWGTVGPGEELRGMAHVIMQAPLAAPIQAREKA